MENKKFRILAAVLAVVFVIGGILGYKFGMDAVGVTVNLVVSGVWFAVYVLVTKDKI